MFQNLKTVKQQILDLDPNVEKIMLVHRTPENRISCYHKLYEKKKKRATAVQTTPDKYFSRKQHIHFSLVFL
jgi:hypothetical protein